jgi:hypothetical protein
VNRGSFSRTMLRKSLVWFSHCFTVRRNLHASANPLCRAIKENDNTECASANDRNKPPRILITGKYMHSHSSSKERHCHPDDQKNLSLFLFCILLQGVFSTFEKNVSLNFVRRIHGKLQRVDQNQQSFEVRAFGSFTIRCNQSQSYES